MRTYQGLVVAFAALAVANPHNEDALEPRAATNTACGVVSASLASQTAAATPTVPAGVAWDCVQSVPIHKEIALEVLDSISPYLQWQTTTSYLKDPPAEYVEKIQPPVDVYAGIQKIRDNIESGKYTKEYDWAFALYHLLQTTHDGHFVYVPDIVGSIFGWRRPMPIVSVSEDGSKIPSIFGYPDVLSDVSGTIDYKPSPIKTIDGVDVYDWLLDYAQIGSLQDRDALYNNIFYNLASAALGTSGTAPGTFAGGGRGRYPYHGATTELGFANGTTKTLQNYASVFVDFSGVQTGADFYKKFLLVTNAQQAKDRFALASQTSSAAIVKGTPWPGYPKAITRHVSGYAGGYYIPDADYDDIAVLALPSFVSSNAQYQKVVEQFLAKAKEAGKKKLVVDVSANGGGTILQGYDVFKQLFPKIEPIGWTRFRAHDAIDIAFQAYSGYDSSKKGFPRDQDKINQTTEFIITEPYDYHNDINKQGIHFKSKAQKYGPHEHHGDEFTSVIRWDLRDPLIVDSSGGIIVTGYQNRKNFTQPFAPEDIVIVYDGYCASTCTIFSQFMREQAGVETIAMGGRPPAEGSDGYPQIQAVGGVKGTNDFPWEYIRSVMLKSKRLATPEQLKKWKKTISAYKTELPFFRAGTSDPVVNSRDGLDKGDPTQTPTQFKYEEADCRILYTPEMTVDVTAIWKAAVDSKWRGKSHCVAGSVGGCGTINTDQSRTNALNIGHVKEKMSPAKVEKLRKASEVYSDIEAAGLRELRKQGHLNGFMAPY